MDNQIETKVIDGAKWSFFAEIIAKLITPILNMILARLLSPEIFGIVASITIVISFSELIAEGGFQKYIIQNKFENNIDTNNKLNTSFWTNFILSTLIWIVIVLIRRQITNLLELQGYEFALVIAALQIPLYSVSSIQLGIIRREFRYKTYFLIRIITAVVPILISIPLALLNFQYWAVIIGTTTSMLISTILYFVFSAWKPSLYYSAKDLKEMLPFVSWSLLESGLIWLTNWFDTILVVKVISDQYLTGLYKQSVVAITGVITLFTAAITPNLYSGLSRLQDDEVKFYELFYKIQKLAAYIFIPLAIGIFFYREVITIILLGEKWLEGEFIVGLWGMISCLVIVYSSLSSEILRAKGQPKLSVLVQLAHLVFIIPISFVGIRFGFWNFVLYRSLARIQIVLVSLIVIRIFYKQSVFKPFRNTIKPLLLSIPTLILSIISTQFDNIYIVIMFIVFSVLIYALMLLFFARKDISDLLSLYKKGS